MRNAMISVDLMMMMMTTLALSHKRFTLIKIQNLIYFWKRFAKSYTESEGERTTQNWWKFSGATNEKNLIMVHL
jgi:hypothetical protein